MTPAVTANALMRFASVEMSTSARIGHTPEKKTHAARDVLNRVDEWAINFHFDRWRVVGISAVAAIIATAVAAAASVPFSSTAIKVL